jgi:hypothetical protein
MERPKLIPQRDVPQWYDPTVLGFAKHMTLKRENACATRQFVR